MLKLLLSLVFWLIPSPALADCGWNADRTFYNCSETVTIHNSVGRTLPVLADSIRFNPAAIATVNTPVGVEGTYSSQTEGDKKLQVSLLKGLPYFGLAASSWTENNFATPNVNKIINKAFANAFGDYQRASGTGYRVGTAVAPPLFNFAHISIGGSIGRGRVSGSTSTAYGITIDASFLSLGVSQNQETLISVLPKARTNVYSLGFTSGGFYAGYSLMKFTIGGFNLDSIHFGSIRYATKNLAVHLAVKEDIDKELRREMYFTGNLQFTLNEKLIFGYVYGLYENAHSASLQLYL